MIFFLSPGGFLPSKLDKKKSESHSVVSDSFATPCSSPGSSSMEFPQGRMLEWVAISFSRGSFYPGTEPGSPALQADSQLSEPPGKPNQRNLFHFMWNFSKGAKEVRSFGKRLSAQARSLNQRSGFVGGDTRKLLCMMALL